MTFDLFPAIDLREGQVVRLVQGDFARETAYGTDPVAVARAHVAAGARWLHIVDLDGARTGTPTQTEQIAAIVAAVDSGVRCQVAGGLRSIDSVRTVLESGAARAVVGTAALRDPHFAQELVREHGTDRIAVALDVRAGIAVGDGWAPGAGGSPVEVALGALSRLEVRTFIATAIDRDGLLVGPDLGLLGQLVALGQGSIIASGGVTTVEDIVGTRDLGCGGAIIGRALYEGRLDLTAALAALNDA